MKCSFAKTPMNGCFKEKWPYGTDIYGRFFYMENSGEQFLIGAFDFCATFPREAERWKKEISKLTGIPEKSIWFHELQVHASLFCGDSCGEVMDNIIVRSAETVKNMMANAQECDCYAAECDMGTEFTYNREQYIEGLGGVTVWSGLKYDEKGTPYTQDSSIMLLRGYKPELPVFEKPVYFDNQNDEMAYLFMFKNKQGETIGTISRFAAHPDVAVLFELHPIANSGAERHYNYDWPGYMSDEMENIYGGISMYVNGPCGDLAVKKIYEGNDTYEKSVAECKRIASLIGGRIREIFNKKARKINIDNGFKTASFEIELPIKEDLPKSYSEMSEIRKQIPIAKQKVEDAIANNENPALVKRLIDDWWRIEYFPLNIEGPEYSFTEEELQTKKMKVHIPALKFGGYMFVGLPAESMCEVTHWLRSRFTGTKTIPLDQVGGHYDYMATNRTMDLGGYTYWCSWIARDGYSVLKKELAPLLDEFLEN